MKTLSLQHRQNISKGLKGIKRTDEQKLDMSRRRLGRRMSPESKKKISDANKGDKNANWQGGKTSINESLRKSTEYQLWRTAVFERDNYTCIWCGKKGVVLNADHIKPFAFYPELRFAIDNGRTLCVPCHKSTGTWGRNIKS